MNINRRKAGFTMAEMLIVVAIIIALLALAFIAVQSYLRSMTQLEYDAAAKEIFVAAQNHLSVVRSQGYLGLKEPAPGESGTNPFGTQRTGNKYYFSIEGGNIGEDSLASMMLPAGAIDGGVLNGNYIICYDREQGVIEDVFYSGSTENSGFRLANRFGNANLDDLDGLLSLRDDATTDRKSSRRNYNGKVIGWYGGATAAELNAIELNAPEIKVVNGDKLYVDITANNNTTSTDGIYLRLRVTGKNSGKVKVIDVLSCTDDKIVKQPETGVYRVILDDVTEASTHFAELMDSTPFQFNKDNSGHLLPGEDIEIEVICSSDTLLAPVRSSGVQTVNSLFGEGTAFDSSDKNKITRANISSIRHLENLAPAISGVGTGTDTTTVFVDTVVQANDLAWTDFRTGINTINDTADQAVSIYNKNGSKHTDSDCFMPIDPEHAIQFNGQSNTIEGLTIKAETGTNSGLFASLDYADTKVENLELVNIAVSGGANAGALAGVSQAEISNVLAHNKRGANAALEISGSGSVGGLVGEMKDGGKIEYSAAALYVKSSGGAAGGLIGTMSAGEISASYAGGHTAAGQYLTTDAESAENRVNVIGTTAGGFVGSLTGGTVNNCYSTCSVKGATAGGFGGAIGGTVTNSYCTGLVLGASDSSTKGAFAGTSTGTVGNTNHYYEIVNYTDGTALEPNCGATAFDATLAAYNDFCPSSPASSYPYDGQLTVHYQGKYPLKDVGVIAGTDAMRGKFVATHYGDWPESETKVENTKG